MVRSLLIATALLLSTLSLRAESVERATLDQDTIRYRYTPIDQTPKIVEFGLRLYDYLHLLPDEDKRANIAVVALPAYSISTGLRLVAVGDIEYRSTLDKSQIDNLRILASASLTGYYDVIIDGYNHFKSKRHSLYYNAAAIVEPSRIYGLDYTSSSTNNPGLYTNQTINTMVGYGWQTSEWLRLTTELDYRWERASKLNLRASEIVHDKGAKYSGLGITLSAQFSTLKATETYSKHGLHARISVTLRPSFLSNYKYNLWQLSTTLGYYQPLWRGALLAAELYAEHQPHYTPWILRLNIGSWQHMRGYYPSRYNGNTLMGGQVELRQHIWQGIVAAIWGGFGTVTSINDPLAWHKILPDYGAGIRYYTTPTSALHIDFGFGRQSYNILVGLDQRF